MDTREAIKGILIEGAKPKAEARTSIAIVVWDVFRLSGNNGWNVGRYYNKKDAEKARAALTNIPCYQADDKINDVFSVEESTSSGYLTQAEFDAISKVTEVTKKD